MGDRVYRILHLGAGVQSTTLERVLEGLDASVFADTCEEPAAVYRHLQWLTNDAHAPILIGTKGRLGDDLITGQLRGKLQPIHDHHKHRFASIPAYTAESEGGDAIGMVRRQCSKEYKIEVIERVIRREILNLKPRQRVPKGVRVVRYIGISLDEAGRAARLVRNYKNPKWSSFEFPLIDRLWTRADCLTYLSGVVPHPVPRSACVFCPYHNDNEWLNIKAVPEDWKRAVEVDEGLRAPHSVCNRNLSQKLYLHRSCLPLTQIEFKPKADPREVQLPMNFTAECMGVCGV